MTASTVIALALAHAALSPGAYAEERPDSLPRYRLSEIVVTAKRVRSAVDNLPLSVSILDRRAVDLSLAHSSTDLAGTLPGVFVQRTGSFGRSDVNIRGLGSRGRRALVLVDGRPERMALFDCTVTHSFPLHNVERVEVVRGPASVLYGSGAMGGVMNVISRRPGPEGGFDVKAGMGNNGTTVITGWTGKDRGSSHAALSLDHRSSDGHLAHAAYEGFDVAGSVGLSSHRGMELSLAAKYFDGYKEEPLRFTSSPGEVSDTWNDYRRGSLDLALEGTLGGAGYQGRYYRNFGEHEFSDGWHSRDATDGIMLHLRGKPDKLWDLAGGMDMRRQSGRLLDGQTGSWDKWDGGAYATVEYAMADFLLASCGVRYNRDEYSGGEICPSLGLLAEIRSGTIIRAGASRAFRAPQINELFMFPSSNEDLAAETLWSYELGLRHRFGESGILDVAGFVMQGENLIELLLHDSPPPLSMFRNVESFDFRGIEASFCATAGVLSARISYAYLDAGRWTRGRPGSKLDVSLLLDTASATLRLSCGRVGDYFASNDHLDRIDSYTVFGLYAERDVPAGIRIFSGVDNIFDERYALITDLPGGEAGLYEMPGRTFIVGLKYGR